MYSWIWRHMPGGTASKTMVSLVMVLTVCLLLLIVVLPWVELYLPFNAVTVG